MEKGILILLKALGIEITPEQVAMVQSIIPQIPSKINQVITTVNNMVENSDARLRANEEEVKKLRLAVENLSANLARLEVFNAPSGNVTALQRSE